MTPFVVAYAPGIRPVEVRPSLRDSLAQGAMSAGHNDRIGASTKLTDLLTSNCCGRVVHIDDGFDFLGFNIRKMRKRGSHKSFVYTRPSTKAIAAIKARVKTMTYRNTLHRDPGYLMEYLGRVLRGWANYFPHGVSKAIFNAIDSYTWERITSWLRKKHLIGWPELRRRYCLPGTWRLTHDGHRFRGAASVTVIRYRYRGYHIPTPWTPTAATSS